MVGLWWCGSGGGDGGIVLVWVDSGGSDSCCKDGIYDCCLMDGLKCVLGGGGD